MNKIHVTLAATLAACSVAFANATDPTVKVQTFENETNTNYIWEPGQESGWTTTPAVATSEAVASDYPAIWTVGSPSVAPTNGFGVVGANHTQVLSLNGGTATVEMPNSDITTSDLLVKVVHSSLDPLSLGDFANSAPRLAIAVDKNGRFNACTNGTANASFFTLSDTVYDEGTWVRVTTLISTNCCRIALNGQLACNGAWLPLASASTERSLTVQSSSCIDDVVVKEAASNVYDKYAAVNPNGTDAVTEGTPSVPTNYTNIYHVVTVNKAVENTYQQGVAPDGTFAITEGSFDGTKVTLTFPGDWPADAYVVKYGSSPDPDKLTSTAHMSSSAKSGDSNTVVVDGITEGTVLYYKVARAQ